MPIYLYNDIQNILMIIGLVAGYSCTCSFAGTTSRLCWGGITFDYNPYSPGKVHLTEFQS